MKKNIILSGLGILILLFPTVGHADQSSELSQVGETDLYLAQNETTDTEDEDDNENNTEDDSEEETTDEEEVNDSEEMSTDGESASEDEEETDFVLIPVFIILTVVIGFFVYNFSKNREE